MIDINSFASRHIGPRNEDIKNMLEVVKCKNLDELIQKTVPDHILFKNKLKETNLKLWNIENGTRSSEKNKDFGPKFVELARGVYMYNDERAKIKLTINNSLGSNKAIEIAQQFAKSKKMAVEIITVLENKPSDEKLKNILKRTQKKFTNSGIKNSAIILEGDPVKTVVKYAKDDSLVMLGVSPKNPILKYFFGSKPISIAQQCNCPVLIAK